MLHDVHLDEVFVLLETLPKNGSVLPLNVAFNDLNLLAGITQESSAGEGRVSGRGPAVCGGTGSRSRASLSGNTAALLLWKRQHIMSQLQDPQPRFCLCRGQRSWRTSGSRTTSGPPPSAGPSSGSGPLYWRPKRFDIRLLLMFYSPGSHKSVCVPTEEAPADGRLARDG